jgi:Flp pilus assembly protein TadB
LFLIVAAAVLVFTALLAALGLVVMALVGIVMGAERLLASLVPAYRRRRRQRYLSMPTGLVRVVRFGARSTQVRFGARSTQPIDVRSSESPHGALEP